MGDPFREANPPDHAFVLCPTCQQVIEVEPGATTVQCTSCRSSFEASHAQTLKEHDAASRLAKALAPIPEDTPRGRNWRKLGILAGFGTPVAMLAGGLLFGVGGLWIGALAVGGVLAAMAGTNRVDPYRDS